MVEMTQAIALLHTARRLIRGSTSDEAMIFLSESEVFLMDAGHKPRYDYPGAPVVDIPLAEADASDYRGLPDMPPALLPMAELTVEAAMCLWEAMLDMTRQAPVTDQIASLATLGEASYRKQVDNWFDHYGTGVMRLAVMQLALACCTEWDLLDEQQQDASAPFDWEFVPAFLRRCIADGRMDQAIRNQYGERVSIEAKPA